MLDEEPQLFHAQGGGTGQLHSGRDRSKPQPGQAPPGVAATTETQDDAEKVATETALTEANLQVLQQAREIASQLSISKPPRDRNMYRGAGKIVPRPYSGFSDEIDMDRTLEVLAHKPVLEPEDIVVSERIRSHRTVVLLVDISGSMKGERILTAAATVGALAAELQDDGLGVIAFWSDAAVLSQTNQMVQQQPLLRELLSLPTQGLTNVSFPLELAVQELAGSKNRDSRAILLSDCVHNAGPDPRIAAARLPRLDVLIDVSGEKDIELGRELALAGHGTAQLVRTYRDVAPALSQIFS